MRLDRAWSRSFPLDAGKGLVHGLNPLLSRAGLLRPVRVEVEPKVSLLLDPNDKVSRTILISLGGRWDPEVRDAIARDPRRAVFLDVGAHIGYDSLKAGVQVGPEGRVVAFEPNPNTLTLLRANIAASGAANVIVQPIALHRCRVDVDPVRLDSGGSSGSARRLSRENAGSATRTYTVRGRPIDDVIAELGLTRVDVLKADVEGAELLVLRGAAQTLRRYHPKLVLEVVPRQLANMNASVEELEAFIKSVGYTTMRQVDYKNREWTLK